MKTHTTIGLITLIASAGFAQAQQKPVLGHWSDPGLDPAVAAVMPRQDPVNWECIVPRGNGGLTDSPTLWPGGIVYYQFDASLSASQITIAKQGMTAWMHRSPAPNVRFLEHTPGDTAHPNWILISSVNGGVSSSYVGIQTVQPQSVLEGTSVNAYVMAHEFCHALGFYHEQSRPDRGPYVSILTGHIQAGYASQFDIIAASNWPGTGLNTPYDFDSVMHYFATAFSTCSSPDCGDTANCATMQALPPYTSWQCSMGQQDHLSVNDVQDMINVYGQRTTALWYVDNTASILGAIGTLANPLPQLQLVPQNALPQDVYVSNGTYNVPPGTRLGARGRYQPHGGVARIN